MITTGSIVASSARTYANLATADTISWDEKIRGYYVRHGSYVTTISNKGDVALVDAWLQYHIIDVVG